MKFQSWLEKHNWDRVWCLRQRYDQVEKMTGFAIIVAATILIWALFV